MAKKSLEYRFQYALNVAKADPNTRIAFAFSTFPIMREAWHTFINLLGKPNGFKYNVINRIATHEDGGSIRFISLEEPNDISGFQFSHAFVDELEDYQYEAVQNKLRSPYAAKMKEPMGLYDAWGVTRRMDY